MCHAEQAAEVATCRHAEGQPFLVVSPRVGCQMMYKNSRLQELLQRHVIGTNAVPAHSLIFIGC